MFRFSFEHGRSDVPVSAAVHRTEGGPGSARLGPPGSFLQLLKPWCGPTQLITFALHCPHRLRGNLPHPTHSKKINKKATLPFIGLTTPSDIHPWEDSSLPLINPHCWAVEQRSKQQGWWCVCVGGGPLADHFSFHSHPACGS